ncbi:diguanylate cyclase [Clostridium botulinum]|uniref:diguanylate cyclase n=1 Tax=Clostridium botulinum TaxID=1491 RepID=UPI000AA3EA54|nr:diguanylate cyclase [Clostridium botulinum]
MELINSKYKILKSIKQDRKTSSYIVRNMVNDKIENLVIINSDYISKKLMNFLINNFIELSNIDTENIIKVFDFGLVNSIDNKSLTYKQYYYTSEYLEESYEINNLITELSYEEIIDIYIQILRGVNYLNLRGLKYEDINFKNIFLCKKHNKYKVKFKDLISIKIENLYLRGEVDGGIIFKAPEILNGEDSTIKSDIYSLGVLIYILLLLKLNMDIDLKQDVYSLINNNKSIRILPKSEMEFDNKFKEILNKMISVYPQDRFDNINEVVKEINNITGKKYKSYNYNEIEKLNFNTPIVDREYELKTIICEYKAMKEKKSENKCIFVHGETGIGKTKILKEIKRILSLEGNLVYSSFPNINNEKNKNFIEIVKKIINSCGKELEETYKSELIKFIPDLGEDKSIIPSEPLASFYEKIRVFKLSESFIKEAFKDKIGVIIIDNIDMFRKFSLELLEYIYNSKIIKNLIIIISYNEENLLNPIFFEFVDKISKNKNTTNMPLSGLSFEGTAALIEKLLGLSEYPIKFSQRIYLKTYGNPLFVEETIKNFFLNKVIYINESTGRWETDYKGNYDSLPIPHSIEQASKNEIKKIDAESYFILEFISIFNEGVSQKIIEEFMKKDGLNYSEIIRDLILKGILCKKIEDTGFIYDFYSKILKDLVYNKIDEKVEMHREVVELLIKYGDNTIENRKDIIYHLEKSYQNIRAVTYYIENANRMLILKNHREALFNLRKAIHLLPERYNDEKIRLLLQISDICMELFNFSYANRALNKAMKLISEKDNIQYKIDILNRISNVYLNKNKLEIALTKIEYVDKLLQDIDYKKGFIDSKIILANIYYKKREYEKVIKICTEGIKECDDNYIKLRVVLYNILGKSNMYLNYIDEAVKDYGKVYLDSKKINYQKGIVLAYSNLATIYLNYYQILDIAEEYLIKVKEICEKNKLLYHEVIVLQKLGQIYSERFQYEKALNIFEKALNKAKYIEYVNGIFNSISFIAILQLKLSNYEEAFKYYKIAEKYIKDNKDSLNNIYKYCLLQGTFLFNLGDLKKTKQYVIKALDIYDEEKSLLRWKAEEILIFIKLVQEHEKINLNKYIYRIKRISNRYKNHLNKLNFIYSVSIIIHELGYKNYAIKLFNYTLTDSWSSINDRIKLKELYFRGISGKGDRKLTFLYEALKLAKKLKDSIIECRIYIKLGDYYYNEEYSFSAYYYLESCEIIRKLLFNVFKNNRMQYCNFNNFIKPFKRLNLIKIIFSQDGEKDYEKNDCSVFDSKFKNEYNIHSERELIELLSFNNLISLLSNKKFMKSLNKIYNSFYSIGICHQKDIISNLTCDSLKNLKLIIQYIASKTLATEAEIVIESEGNEFITIASLTGNNIRKENKEIFQRVKKTKNSFVIFNNEINLDNFQFTSVTKEKKAIACIPVIMCYNDSSLFRSQQILKRPVINGYIYISSEKFMNNISKRSIDNCIKLVNLIAYIIDKYQLNISCSIDKLTGAYTRKYLEEKLSESIEYANFNNDKFSIIMFDLDHFKNINDTFGHQVGDKVLHSVCNTVMHNLRGEDICGRYGGEEFIAVLPGVDNKEALKIAERIRMAIEESKIIGDETLITISAGIATYPCQAQLKRELIEKADQALYMAKDLGRNRCQIWRSEFGNKVKVTSKLTGIISGNFPQDSRNVLGMIELMDIISESIKIEEKIHKILGHIIGITEAEYANLIFMDENNNIFESFGRKRLQEDWSYEYSCNEKIIEKVIQQRQGICVMDWNEAFNYDLLTVLPEWYSIMAIPITKNDIIKSILYLSVPCKIKKFSRDELNFVTILSRIITYIN